MALPLAVLRVVLALRVAPELDVAARAAGRPHLWPLVSIQVLRQRRDAAQEAVREVDEAALQAGLPQHHRNPRASWFSRLTGQRLSRLHLLLRLLLQQEPGAVHLVVLGPVAVAVEQVAAVEEPAVAPRVALRLQLFPESGRNLPEPLWSHGILWPRRNAGTRMTAARAITRAARFRPPAIWYSQASEATYGSIAPTPARSSSMWTFT